MIVNAQKYVTVKRFEEVPQRTDFVRMQYALPELPDKHILVQTEWLSVDIYQRSIGYRHKLPYDQFGYQIGKVIESKDKNYPVGTRVVSHKGWCDYSIIDPNVKVKNVDFSIVDFGAYKLPDLKDLPISLGLGAVGIPGATAYFGVVEILKPEPGEVVAISVAAGAIGSIVGQIVKIKGCKAMGFTGSDEKADWLKNELGFDFAFNYNTVDFLQEIPKAAPNGIDCFFDNVGGNVTYTIMSLMKIHGRVAISGTINDQNKRPSEKFETNFVQPVIMIRQLRVEGFLVYRWQNRWPEAFAQLAEWIRSGQLKAKEDVTEGFTSVVDVFLNVLNGENYGQALVKVS